jgi:hypothetical protein
LSHCEIKIVVRLPSRRFQAAARAWRRVCIQAFVMNVFGSIDNLAWIWVSKKRLDVHHNSVGLIPKCKTFRETLSLEMQGCLHKLEPWFDYIVDYRDALAHRIPLFIAPYIVPDENVAAYTALEDRIVASRDVSAYERLKIEQLKLGAFEPVMKHTLDDDKGAVGFHFQLLSDFATVEEIAQQMPREFGR